MSQILVIIVTYNAMKWVENCFDSLRNSTVKPDVFVVDNGSDDGTQWHIQNYYPEVMFLQNNENSGFGKANNIGLQYALEKKYDYIYLLNQDAWVLEDTFQKLINFSHRNPEYGVLSPFQMNSDLKHIDQDFIKNVMCWESNHYISSDLYNQQLKEVYPVTEVMAAHWFITRECLLKVGGFSPSFPHYGEDNNYADRMHYWGLKLGIIPSLRVVHDRGERVINDKSKMHFQYTSLIRMMSNPYKAKRKSFFKILYKEIQSAIHFRSFLPIYYLWKILCRLYAINHNRLISMTEECAFLIKNDI